ncbi:leukocyte-associated immunoglobulin-like receptor 1 isoform X2 [Chionomys nivalis]|uniref:leukocyte-associated immunoglobulin-like receptor 1 isoform X2 n=1 Tax=Chionomys nivalis TaxID=269649 RepID=UPI0025915B3E|nr:leukocyte-associated immunoglobulin-like receptor 1 isoform X2 [Chionomys nivalis]
MSLHSATVMALVLCLGWIINTQHESLPSPSILADPGLEIPQGHSVKFVCTSPSEYDTFRLEKRSTSIMDVENVLPYKKQAIFQIGPVNEDTAGSYQCLYQKESMWSQRSETLELKVTSEDVPHTSDPVPGVTSDTSWLKTNNIYILIGVTVVFLLCLLLFLLFCFHSHRQKKQGLPNSKSQEHRQQKRLSLVTNGLESTSGIVTDDLLPEDKRTETLIPDAGGLQEVTYAQLDHHALTQRTAGDVTPQSRETKTESSTYAAIIRR